MKRPFAYSAIAFLAAFYGIGMFITTWMAGDLFVRVFAICGTFASAYVVQGLWTGKPDAPRRIVLWGGVTILFVAALSWYARAFQIDRAVQAMISGCIMWIVFIGACAFYVRRKRWVCSGDSQAPNEAF